MLVMAFRHRQQWEVDYLGHVIRFENGIYTSGRLMIDGNIVASGGVGFQAELSGRIPRGAGVGHRIVAKTQAGFRFFRCQFFAEPNTMAPPKEAGPVALDQRVNQAVSVGLPGWFHRRASRMQFLIQIPLVLVVVAACLAMDGSDSSFRFETVADERKVQPVASLSVGQPSPWLTAEVGGPQSGFHFHPLATSVWVGLAGIASMSFLGLLRRTRPGADAAKAAAKQRE